MSRCDKTVKHPTGINFRSRLLNTASSCHVGASTKHELLLSNPYSIASFWAECTSRIYPEDTLLYSNGEPEWRQSRLLVPASGTGRASRSLMKSANDAGDVAVLVTEAILEPVRGGSPYYRGSGYYKIKPVEIVARVC